jgi:hypothetical protein
LIGGPSITDLSITGQSIADQSIYLPDILCFANIFVPPQDQSQFSAPLSGIL